MILSSQTTIWPLYTNGVLFVDIEATSIQTPAPVQKDVQKFLQCLQPSRLI